MVPSRELRLFNSIAADGVARTPVPHFCCECYLRFSFRLFPDVRVAQFVIPTEKRCSVLAADVTVDARIVHVEWAWDVARLFVWFVSHSFLIGLESAAYLRFREIH